MISVFDINHHVHHKHHKPIVYNKTYFSLCTEVKQFIRRLPHWLRNSLENVPKQLSDKKLEGTYYNSTIF